MSLIVREYLKVLPFVMSKPNLDSDVYNNCILLEKCINRMAEKNLFSTLELDILVAFIQGFSYVEIAKLLFLERHTVSIILEKITDRISFILGDLFSDAYLLDAMDIAGINNTHIRKILSKRNYNE